MGNERIPTWQDATRTIAVEILTYKSCFIARLLQISGDVTRAIELYSVAIS